MIETTPKERRAKVDAYRRVYKLCHEQIKDIARHPNANAILQLAGIADCCEAWIENLEMGIDDHH